MKGNVLMYSFISLKENVLNGKAVHYDLAPVLQQWLIHLWVSFPFPFL